MSQPFLIFLGLLGTLVALRLLLRRAKTRKAQSSRRPIVIDGSNVLYWQNNTPDITSVRAVVKELSDQGYRPGVVFDANAGYLVTGRYQNDHALGRLLGLPADRVLVAPKGTPADPLILAAARDMGAAIVSNDRYRDWLATHPEAANPGHLIRGGFQAGKLRLDL